MTRDDLIRAIIQAGGSHVLNIGIAEHTSTAMNRFQLWAVKWFRLARFLWPVPRVEVIIMGRKGLMEEKVNTILETLNVMRPAGLPIQVRAFVDSDEVLH